MTPLPLRSTRRRLALCNTATGLRAPRELSLVRNPRAEGRRTAQQAKASEIDLALGKQVTEDQTMGDDGDEKQGVQELT